MPDQKRDQHIILEEEPGKTAGQAEGERDPRPEVDPGKTPGKAEGPRRRDDAEQSGRKG